MRLHEINSKHVKVGMKFKTPKDPGDIYTIMYMDEWAHDSKRGILALLKGETGRYILHPNISVESEFEHVEC